MQNSDLAFVVDTADGEYMIVRPGFSICFIYADTADEIGLDVARILEEYLEFIPDGALQTYLSDSGSWKKATHRTFNSVFANLLDVGEGNYSEFHFGQEPAGNVGDYGAHFKAGPLDDELFDKEANILHLEFPMEFAALPAAERLAEFFARIVRIRAPDSGYCGYAFKHLFMTFANEALEFIARKAMRYTGFDVPEDAVRFWARGRVYNVSWLTVLGPGILAKLGGKDKLRQQGASELAMFDVGEALVMRAAELPIVGDVNRGAADVKGLRKLAEITKPVRIELEMLGPSELDLATRWPNRFDPPGN
jgi:hypothetical protein